MHWLCHQGGRSVAELGHLGSRPFLLVTWLLPSTDKLSQRALSMVPPRALTPGLGTREEKVLIWAFCSRILVAQAHPPGQSLRQLWRPQDFPARLMCLPWVRERCRRVTIWRQGKGVVSKIRGLFLQEIEEWVLRGPKQDVSYSGNFPFWALVFLSVKWSQ